MNRWTRYLEVSLNALAIAVLLVCAMLLIRREIATEADTDVPPEEPVPVADALQPGSALSIPAIEWNTPQRHLILALALDCPYCRASLPFYRRLLSEHSAALQTIALFPEAQALSAEFLRSNGVSVDLVRQSDLSALGVKGTPTLILTDASGKVLNTWTGQLSARAEGEIQTILRRPATNRELNAPARTLRLPQMLDLDRFQALAASASSFTFIDSRERTLFRVAHLERALNIPLDELEQRAVHEARKSDAVVLFCEQACACKRPVRSTGLSGTCRIAVSLLRHAGFQDVRVLGASLDDLRTAGTPLVGSQSVSLPRLTLAENGSAR